MKIELPKKVSNIIQTLERAGYGAFAVGGCIRDSILGRKPQDWDITTSAKPQEVKRLFSHTINTGIQHGTVTVMLGHEGYEVTTYRIDGEYEDARHPKEVIYTGDLFADLKRRDFTINAMAYNEKQGLVDAFDGIEDLKRKMIRCVGKATDRFSEDALRMLRALRFAAQLGFEVEESTFEAIKELAPTIQKISVERIQAELVKLLLSDHPQFLREVYESGIAQEVLPEFAKLMETEQNHPHHCYSVGEHTIRVVQNVPKERVLRLAALFHDIAKPICQISDEQGVDHFHGHPKKGAIMAHEIFRRLKFDVDTMQKVCKLIEWHDDNPPLEPSAVRRAIHRAGEENYPNIFLLKRADILAQSDYKKEEKLQYIDDYEKVYKEILKEKNCISLKDLAVNGKDLISLGVKPGKEIGEILNGLLEMVLDEPSKNQKEYLLGIVKEQWLL
ncbi:MAG: CCA tRNA nucleotidyltransferase [Lachnospiraceae bacterium]|nr:CCA tRNA nucleotidyltransferase [Lachnospiraceae bacterium]